MTADIEGRYTSLPLPPGEYRVEATLQGFKSAARSNAVVTIASTVIIDFALGVTSRPVDRTSSTDSA